MYATFIAQCHLEIFCSIFLSYARFFAVLLLLSHTFLRHLVLVFEGFICSEILHEKCRIFGILSRAWPNIRYWAKSKFVASLVLSLPLRFRFVIILNGVLEIISEEFFSALLFKEFRGDKQLKRFLLKRYYSPFLGTQKLYISCVMQQHYTFIPTSRRDAPKRKQTNSL